MRRILWSNLIDKTYYVRVDQFSHTEGRLYIMHKGKVLHSEPVTISYGARFGVDVQDEEDWVTKACRFIDSLKAPNYEI